MPHDPTTPRVRSVRGAVARLVALTVCALASAAYAGPKVTLTYHGDNEGLPATAAIEFEDVRSGVSPVGFALYQARPA